MDAGTDDGFGGRSGFRFGLIHFAEQVGQEGEVGIGGVTVLFAVEKEANELMAARVGEGGIVGGVDGGGRNGFGEGDDGLANGGEAGEDADEGFEFGDVHGDGVDGEFGHAFGEFALGGAGDGVESGEIGEGEGGGRGSVHIYY